MTSQCSQFADLSDDQLLAEVQRLASTERRATVALLRSSIELDARRLYLREGYSSLFTYCTEVLRLSEGGAYNRIEVARAARRWPSILDYLEEGTLTLATARLLAPHLAPDTYRDVLAAARGKSKREVELLVVSLHPRPPQPPSIRKVPVHSGACSAEPARADDLLSTRLAAQEPESQANAAAVPPRVSARPSQASVTPHAADRYKIQLTVSAAVHDKLRRAQNLLRHTIPGGDLGEIFDRAITALLDDLERRRCAATSSPRSGAPGTSASRHIPAAVRRAVWRRDGGQCAFIGARGRCRETGFLELHHVMPYAAGGAATTENIELRCRAHNAYEATLFFGGEDDGLVREVSPLWGD
jgi:hypothetical protein